MTVSEILPKLSNSESHFLEVPVSESASDEEDETIFVLLPVEHRTKFSIENALKPLINRIAAEKKKQLFGRKVIFLTVHYFCQEAKKKPQVLPLKNFVENE
jgi:hypothetical protein